MKRKLFTLLFLCLCSKVFAQYTPEQKTKDSILQPTKKVEIIMPGAYMKKAGNYYAASMFFGIATSLVAIQVKKKENLEIVYLSGGTLSLAFFLSGSINLDKAGQTIDKLFKKK